MGTNRMMSDLSGVYAKMFQLRKTRKEFVGDDFGSFYRNMKLQAMIWSGEITEDNIEEYMTAEKMSEGNLPPMEWYHLHAYPHPQDAHDELLQRNYYCGGKKKNMRGRITRLRFQRILRDILARRIDRFLNPDKYMNNKILCIVGDSGAGKTLASLHLQNKLGANVICSYTTRPPRTTEVEGREHHFINIVPDPNELLAYANFGGYEYYALKTQVWGDCTVYVIDEQGLKNLREDHGDEYQIYSVYITRSWSERKKSGVKLKRMERDSTRDKLSADEYDWITENNSTKKNLFINIEAIYNAVKNK